MNRFLLVATLLAVTACAIPGLQPNPSEPFSHVTEPEIICERMVPTGSLLPVMVCRRQSDIARRQEADQELFDRIKRNTAIGASRL